MRASVAACCASGSFPLTQGKQVSVTRHRHHRGLIPAHAGKTAAPAWTPGGRPVHPRSGGENWSLRPSHLWMWGSSPLTRGKPAPTRKRKASRGLIPAHAGKTGVGGGLGGLAVAHPRSRGENLPLSWDPPIDVGSSPLTRGKPARGVAHSRSGGAHPRSRGENRLIAASSWSVRGSSPLTRGKLVRVRPQGLGERLIPAHAGKTCEFTLTPRPAPAHPRSRGENESAACASRWWMGSSPLTRGKRSARSRSSRTEGLIPAHAGKTSRPVSRVTSSGAHPRSRGENSHAHPR